MAPETVTPAAGLHSNLVRAASRELLDDWEAERRAMLAMVSPSVRDALRLAELPAARRRELLVREALADIRAERAERAAYEAETRRLAAAVRAGANRACAELPAGRAPLPAHEDRAESPGDRQARRLERFHALGGHMVGWGDGWRCAGRRGALADLAREEAASGRARSDRSDVRRDLIDALGVHRGC